VLRRSEVQAFFLCERRRRRRIHGAMREQQGPNKNAY
jgi:hypothetical protein